MIEGAAASSQLRHDKERMVLAGEGLSYALCLYTTRGYEPMTVSCRHQRSWCRNDSWIDERPLHDMRSNGLSEHGKIIL